MMLPPRFQDVCAPDSGAINSVHRTCTDLAIDHEWHFHPQHELTWFLRSSGTRFIGSSVERYGEGDLILAGPNLPHCWRNDRIVGGQQAEWITIQFAPSCFGRDFLNLPEAGDLARLLAEADFGILFPGEIARKVGTLLREVHRARGIRRVLKLAEALDRLAGAPRKQVTPLPQPHEDGANPLLIQRLDRIMQYVQDNFRTATSQADLAKELGLTASAFSRFTRAATGHTFTGMIKRARINEACRLLANSTASITSIALECGYQHTSHFDHHFVELQGVTPREYRKLMRQVAPALPSRKIAAIRTANAV